MQTTKELMAAYEEKANTCGLVVQCPGGGMFSSTIAIVSDYPGAREVAARLPFVGGAGTKLWNTLRKFGFDRNDFYITNVCKRIVAGDDDENIGAGMPQKLSRGERELWQDLIKWELAKLPNLRYILCLGGLALEALTGHDGITSWRGSVLDISLQDFENRQRPKLVTLLCSFNPASVLRTPKDELIFNMDLGRLRRVIEGRWKPHLVAVSTNPDVGEAVRYLQDLRAIGGPVAYDIETMGGETACVGFANNPHEAMCINFRTATEHRFTVEEELAIRAEIQATLAEPSVQLIAQNGMFDSSWLWYKDRLRPKASWLDTMLAHHTLYPWMPHDLGFLCTQYTTHPFYKHEKDWREGGDIDTYWTYNGKDCCITFAVAMAIKKELEAQQLDRFFFEHVMKLQPWLVRMTVGGVLVDTALRESINEALEKELRHILEDFHAAVHEATGDPSYSPNPLSSHALSDLLFGKLGLIGRGASTNEENRDRMYKHPRSSEKARRVLEALKNYKREQKFFSTYVDTEIDEDNRMRCEYKQTGVSKAPGRLSSSKVLWGHYDQKSKRVIQHGMNLQNQPTRAHEMYIADPGYTFVYADGEQAEARYVGWDAEIEVWMEQFERARLDGKYDAHRALAALLYNLPYEDTPTSDEETLPDGKVIKSIRYKAKRCRHALNYRMMADRLATTAGIPLDEAEKLFGIYHRLHPELRKWWSKQEETARSSRFLFNSYGRRLFIQGDMNQKETLESIVAFRPQSTIGDKVSRAIYMCEEDDDWPYDARMALNIHDAIVALCRIDDAYRCAKIIKRHMEEPITVRPSLPPLIIPCAVGISQPDDKGVRRWSTIKKIKEL